MKNSRVNLGSIPLLMLGVCFIAVLIISLAHNAYAACVMGKHIPNTAGDQALCDRETRLETRKKEVELEEQSQELRTRSQGTYNKGTGSGTGNTNVILGNLLDTEKSSSKTPEVGPHPLESKFEIGFNMPANFIFPFQQGAPGYMFSTQVTQLRLQYNFAEFMHLGGSYIDQKIDAVRFKDSNAGYYVNNHWIIYIGARGWMAEGQQIQVNGGLTSSDSYPEGESDKSGGYSTGVFAEVQYMFVYDSIKIGPALTIILAAKEDAEYRADNEKASFIRFGINATFGLPFGYVGAW
ncbi:hypothetical protein KKI24_17035 [bacterium]|nr:hypothetical protein [bacterium]